MISQVDGTVATLMAQTTPGSHDVQLGDDLKVFEPILEVNISC